MKDFKVEATKLLNELKAQNPMSTWKNLTTGLVVVLVVVFLSVAYFNRLTATGVVQPLGDVNFKSTEKEMTAPSKDNEKTPAKEMASDYVEVQDGEGLWHVAQRVCGSGEKYSTLAEANGLTIYSEVVVGQKLLKKCE